MIALALLLAAVPAPGGHAPATAPAPAPARAPAPDRGGPAGKRAATPEDARRERIAGEMIRLGAALQRDLERGDAGAILARVPEAGLRCAGQVVPKARVARDLANTGSWLHRVLFGPAGDRRNRPDSLRAFLAAAPEVAVFVAFRKDARAGPIGLPCLEFRARDLETPGAPFCFDEVAGRWWFAESLYPCG